jgi:hypothetical protein
MSAPLLHHGDNVADCRYCKVAAVGGFTTRELQRIHDYAMRHTGGRGALTETEATESADGRYYYCPLAPCTPHHVVSPYTYGSVSFATMDGYLRHIERGHFLSAAEAPRPFIGQRPVHNYAMDPRD